VYLASSVIPRLLHEPSLGGRLDPASLATLQPVPCPGYQVGVEYWERKSAERRAWAQLHYPAALLRRALACSLQTAPRLDLPTIAQLAAFHPHAEWTATHAPANPPLGHVPAPHETSAPLTLCALAPGLPPFLTRHSTDSHGEQVRRARLALGRSRTGTVRLRFAKKAEAPGISPHCTRCSQPGAPVDESIPHMLLACTRHAAARTQLTSKLHTLGLHAPLSLSTILATTRPPPPFTGSRLPHLLRATSRFLTAIHSDRAREQLPPLDTG
jgi:hypothetical protein